MRTDDALTMRKMAADFGRWDCRTIAGEDRIRRDQLSISAKICCFSGNFSGAASKTKAASCKAGASASWAAMRSINAAIVVEKIGDRAQALRQRCAEFGGRFEHGDVVTRGSEQISDAVTHQAAADDAYVLAGFCCFRSCMMC